jgi:hypothetical protein
MPGKKAGKKGAGFPPAREQRSEYNSFAGQQNIHSIALGRRLRRSLP